MSAVSAVEAVPVFPIARECPYQLPPGYDTLRAQGPVTRVRLRSGHPAWLVTGHAQVRALLCDPRISTDRAHPGYPELTGRRADPDAVRAVRTFVEMDPPEHGRHRRVLTGRFTVRGMRDVEPVLRGMVDALLDRMIGAGPPTDLMAALGHPLPAMLLAHLFGVPAARRDQFLDCVQEGGRRLPELRDLLGELLSDKRAGDGDDLLGDLADGQARPTGATDDDLLNTAMMIVVAGSETTANMIGLGVLALLEHPGQLATLRRSPAGIPAAVEELLRYLSIADTLPRVALADIEIAGTLIEAGDGVILSTAAANRDAGCFDDPDVLRLDRPARRHLAFGFGPHQCLGQNLARAGLEAVYAGLLRRIPTLTLAVPADRLPVKGAVGLQGVTALPVTW